MELASVWGAVLGEIELSVSKASFRTWFESTNIQSVDDSTLEVSVSNIFAKNQMEHKFDSTIKKLLQKHGVVFKSIVYRVGEPDAATARRAQTKKDLTVKTDNLTRGTQINSVDVSTGINDRYTFENFIVGDSNELAYTACLAAAKDVGKKYNPLFIYGGVGLGKTHLIQAVGNYVLEANPGMKVSYISSEKFIKDFVDCIRNKRPFTDEYRKCDVLIVDDIQFMGSAEKTQEEFFHTFNDLHQNNKQVILSCDRQPKSIPGLTDRLQSRFEWGMNIDIQSPNYETRCAILQSKSVSAGTELPQETTEYLAANIQSNVRELEGALNQLLAFCEVREQQPSLETAKALLNNTRVRPKLVTVRDVVAKTAEHFDLSEEVIKSSKRNKEIVVPRQIAMYLLRSELHISFPKIATELGRKDHTTAIHSVEKIQKAINFDQLIRQQVNSIKDQLYA